MNKRVKILLITLSLSIFVVGCNNKEVSQVKQENNNTTQQIETSERVKLTNEELYKIYDDNFEEVKDIFIDNNRLYEEEVEEDRTYLHYKGYSTSSIGNDLDLSQYKIVKDEKGNIEFITASLSLLVDEDKEFKLEDTLFYDLSKALIDREVDYTDTNNKINNALNSKIDQNILNTYDNIQEDIFIYDGNIINYVIQIKP